MTTTDSVKCNVMFLQNSHHLVAILYTIYFSKNLVIYQAAKQVNTYNIDKRPLQIDFKVCIYISSLSSIYLMYLLRVMT